MTTLSAVAKTAPTIVEGVIDHEGIINAVAGFIPGMPMAAVTYAEKGLPMLRAALILIQQESGKSWAEAFSDLIDHLTPGKPGPPALDVQPATSAVPDRQAPE